MKKIAVINGANLNLLGSREPKTYGSLSYDELCSQLVSFGKEHGAEVINHQSNVEGELVSIIQSCAGFDGIIINAGGYTHTSVVIRDAITAVNVPTIEVHISNIAAREGFRHTSMLTGVCRGCIFGLGFDGYKYAILDLIK